MKYLETEVMGIVHYGLNTYADREWGFGDTPTSAFAPTRLDPEQWVVAAKAGGLKRLVLVCKHHDGFCLFPSKLNPDYTIANTSWKGGKGDLVREFRDACTKHGMEFGAYLSPWDRHQANYASSAYADYFQGQWDELLAGYGPISEIWLDGANGGDGWYGGAKETRKLPSDARAYYRFDELLDKLEKQYPNAIAFGGGLRPNCAKWCGNETGMNNETSWNAQDGAYVPNEADTPFRRRGWFWHPDDQPKSLAELVDVYFMTVGRNSVLDLGIAPNRDGVVGDDDVARLKEFGDYIRAFNATDLAADARRSDIREGRRLTVSLKLPIAKAFNVIDLKEDIAEGQRVGRWTVEANVGGSWIKLAAGTTIGYRRMERFGSVEADEVRIVLEGEVGTPLLKSAALRFAPLVKGESQTQDFEQWRSPVKLTEPSQDVRVYDLLRRVAVDTFQCRPPKDRTDGVPDKFAIYASDDGESWREILKGEFGNLRANPVMQRVSMPEKVETRYLKLVALHALDGTPRWEGVLTEFFRGKPEMKLETRGSRDAADALVERHGPWTKEKAWEWYDAQPWIRGCNYMPASCANHIDLWQEYGSEARFEEMEREMALMEKDGFNAVRLLLGDYGLAVWRAEHDGMMKRFERMLEIFDRHGVRVILIFGNDCSRPKSLWSLPPMGEQKWDLGYHAGRKQSQHGSFPDEPGYTVVDDPALCEEFFAMCEEFLTKYAHDRRILFWNLWNEPGANNRGNISPPHIRRLFKLAWKINPDQPLAADLYTSEAGWTNNAAQSVGMELNDIISYHCDQNLENQIGLARTIRERLGRPMINTEWLGRVFHCNVQDLYPFFAQSRIGCTRWGYVNGKYQTHEPWEGTWRRAEEDAQFAEEVDVTRWFHDLYRPSLRPYDPAEVAIIRRVNAEMDAEYRAKFKGEGEGSLRMKIAKSHKITGEDMWYGYRRTTFDFDGRTAWIVEPSVAPAKGMPWTWTMQWAEAFVDRTGVIELLKRGYHHVTIDLFETRMDDEGIAAAADFQKFLVDDLGFAPKANLVGMSWGGFFSVRYAAARPVNVAKIYLDAPRLNLDRLGKADGGRIGAWSEEVPLDGNWSNDPRMPVNMAEKIAAAKIPVLLLYGGADTVVPPDTNCEPFIERFKAAGGEITIDRRGGFGHHPHGLDPDKLKPIVDFFVRRKPASNARPEELVDCPVSNNLRGHENVEWSRAYAFSLTDDKRDLPRVFLVGDSICNGYQEKVRELLDGKMNVSYWISSYCVTSPGYLRLLDFYLDEAKYDVVHFNNGLHSLQTAEEDYEKGLRAALAMIRAKQPGAKIIWATSTPLKDPEKTEKAKRLNAVAAKVISEFEDIEVDDLFSEMDPLDRETNWGDTYHFVPEVQASQAKIVVHSIECARSRR